MNEQIRMKDTLSIEQRKGVNEQIRIKAHLNIKCYNEKMELREERDVYNTVSSAAKYGIMDQILASPTGVGYTAKPGWLEVGTGSPGSTTLGAYVSGSRTALSSSTRSGAVVTMVCTLGAGVGTGALTEAGIFDVVTQNTQYWWVSASFGTATKGAGDTFVFTWTLTQN